MNVLFKIGFSVLMVGAVLGLNEAMLLVYRTATASDRVEMFAMGLCTLGLSGVAGFGLFYFWVGK